MDWTVIQVQTTPIVESRGWTTGKIVLMRQNPSEEGWTSQVLAQHHKVNPPGPTYTELNFQAFYAELSNADCNVRFRG